MEIVNKFKEGSFDIVTVNIKNKRYRRKSNDKYYDWQRIMGHSSLEWGSVGIEKSILFEKMYMREDKLRRICNL